MWTSLKKNKMLEVLHKTTTRKGDIYSIHELENNGDEKFLLPHHYPVYVHDTDKQIIITPFNLETLEDVLIDFKSEDEQFKVTAIAGIRDEEQIHYLGTIRQKGEKYNLRQYFFKNDEPFSFNYHFISGPGFPLNMDSFIKGPEREYFDTLKNTHPKVSASLDACIDILSVPGPEYKLDDTGIMLKFP